ncbi:MAG: phosphotransferase [Gemmatimonadota bacterium]|nr:phosphotransferase [Gemmatimonadota bacterium]
MTTRDVEDLLVSLELNHGRIHPITGGWSYWTFEVGLRAHDDHADSSTPGWIFRFPRNRVVTENLQKEQAILPVVAPRINFAVPRFEHAGCWNGQPYAGYRRIPGRPLSDPLFTGRNLADEVTGSIAAALSLLHDIPTSLVAEACAVEPTVDAWRQQYRALRNEVRDNVMPLLESTTAAAVERGFSRFLDEELATLEDVALVHCDLGCEHILIEDDGTTVTGLIDFEDVTIGDPTIDFVGIYVTYGMEAVDRIRDCYQRRSNGQRGSDGQRASDIQRPLGVRRALDVNFVNRLQFYTWMASCHEVIYGLEEGKSYLVEEGITGLQDRLGRAGLL